jgi:hypothetical protein
MLQCYLVQTSVVLLIRVVHRLCIVYTSVIVLLRYDTVSIICSYIYINKMALYYSSNITTAILIHK